MGLSLDNKLVAGFVGAAIVGGLAFVTGVILPAAIQTVTAKQPEVVNMLRPAPVGSDVSLNLLKFDDRTVAVETEPGIDLTGPYTTITKIGYGKPSTVRLINTPSGTISTDAFADPMHSVHYPGVRWSELDINLTPAGSLYGWSHLTGWVKVPVSTSHSYSDISDLTRPLSQHGVCVADTLEGGCR
jgi:hypothetical protein